MKLRASYLPQWEGAPLTAEQIIYFDSFELPYSTMTPQSFVTPLLSFPCWTVQLRAVVNKYKQMSGRERNTPRSYLSLPLLLSFSSHFHCTVSNLHAGGDISVIHESGYVTQSDVCTVNYCRSWVRYLQTLIALNNLFVHLTQFDICCKNFNSWYYIHKNTKMDLDRWLLDK